MLWGGCMTMEGTKHEKATSSSSSSSRASNSNSNNSSKVWRTLNVSTGGEPPQAMTPEAAAKYIQQATSASREVKISFGPSSSSSSSTQAARFSSSSSSSSGAQSHASVSFGSLDLAALARAGDLSSALSSSASAAAAAAVAATNSAASKGSSSSSNHHHHHHHGGNHSSSSSKKKTNKDGLPCSEAEMKALMSMFVEIMGMNMDTDKLSKTTASKKKKKKKTSGTASMSAAMAADKSSGSAMFMFGSSSSTSTSPHRTRDDVTAGLWPGGPPAGLFPDSLSGATGMGAWGSTIGPSFGDDDDDDDDDVDEEDEEDDDEDEDDDDDDSLPDLDEVRDVMKNRKPMPSSMAALAGPSSDAQHQPRHPIITATNTSPKTPSVPSTLPSRTTGKNGIAPMEWESLEQVAIDDAMEAEERARKAAKKREKKQRKKEKARKEAAARAAEAAQKKREKALVSWRSRVVSACQSNEVSKLEVLLSESPLQHPRASKSSSATSHSASLSSSPDSSDTPQRQQIQQQQQRQRQQEEQPEDVDQSTCPSVVAQHLEFLLPNSVAKTRQQVEKGQEAREKLTRYILSLSLSIAFTPLRNGRSALHTACFLGDISFVRQVVTRAADTQQPLLPQETSFYLNITCSESGWSPLHYALFSGSHHIMELLLDRGCNVRTHTDEVHTWRNSDGKGVTPRELAEMVLSGKQETALETHGMALSEATSHFLSSSSDLRRRFLALLERLRARLADVERNGYTPLETPTPPSSPLPTERRAISGSDTCRHHSNPGSEDETATPAPSAPAGARKRKKKKKKGKHLNSQQQQQDEARSVSSGSVMSSATNGIVPLMQTTNNDREDPLIVALLGMGFQEEQIHAAVKACGGTNRATADDLVAWIFSNQEDSAEASNGQNQDSSPKEASEPDTATDAKEASAPDEDAQKKEAKRLEEAAKREEEARSAAERLAAKREETRRRNREWNNREQARQRSEAQMKLAQAAELRARAEAQRAAFSSLPMPPPGGYYPTAASSGRPAGSVTIARAPPAAGVATGNAMMPPLTGKPANAKGSNSNILAPKTEPTVPVTTPSVALPPPKMMTPVEIVKRPPPEENKASRDQKEISSPVANESAVAEAPRPHNQSSVPPGFRLPPKAATPPPPAPEPSQPAKEAPSAFAPDVNPLGEIRATAKAFVPSNFMPASVPPMASGNNADVSLVPGASGPFVPPGSSTNPSLSGFPAGTGGHSLGFPSVDAVASGSSAPRVGPPALAPVLGGASASGSPSLLGAPAFDSLSSVTPPPDQSDVPPSAASSVTGISSAMEEAPATLSSLPAPIGYGPDPSAIGPSTTTTTTSTAAAPPLLNNSVIGGSSIWGDSLLSSSSGFGGLSSLLEGNMTTHRQGGSGALFGGGGAGDPMLGGSGNGNQAVDEPHRHPGSRTWGSSHILGGGGSNGGGSIW